MIPLLQDAYGKPKKIEGEPELRDQKKCSICPDPNLKPPKLNPSQYTVEH